MDSATGWGIGLLMLIIVCILISLLPIYIAFKRGHHYRWIITVLCLFPTGITWIVAFIWAVWPQDKSLADPIAGNVTGLGNRNVGDTAGAVKAGGERGYADEKSTFTSEQNIKSIQANRNIFDGEMNLESGPYQLFLLKKHKIEKIDALNKFTCQEKLFDSSDEALKYADFLEQKEVALVKEEIENEKRHQELLRKEELKAKEQERLDAIASAERRKIQDAENEVTQAKFRKYLIFAIIATAVIFASYFGYNAYTENKIKTEQAKKFNQIKEVTAKFGLVNSDGTGIKWSKDCSSNSYNFYVNIENDRSGNWVVMVEPPNGALTFSSQDISLDNGLLKMVGVLAENTTEAAKAYAVGSPFVLTFKRVNGGIRIIDWTIGANVVAKNGMLLGGNGDPTNIQMNCSK